MNRLILALLVTVSQIQAQSADAPPTGMSFRPDTTFEGSSLSAWKPLGDATWSAKDGEITAISKAETSGGFLMTGRSYQDVAIRALFQATGETEPGFLFRLEKTDAGMKGILVSVKDNEAGSYAVEFDSKGVETKREKLRSAGRIVRLAPPPDPKGDSEGGGRRGTRPSGPADIPIKRPDTSYRREAWNQIEIFMDLNIVRSFLNDGGETAGGAAEETLGKYGPCALYVRGEGEVHFKEISFKDLSVRNLPKEQSADRFEVQRINDMYYSWGATAGDFNKDGVTDVIAGPYLYFGPDFTTFREIYPGITFNPSKEFTDTNTQYAYDFNGDGWLDLFNGTPRAAIYFNPKGESRRWDKVEVIPSVQTEVTVFTDIDGSGVPALVYGADGAVRFAKPDLKDPTKWNSHAISPPGYSIGHGIGAGDINGDGRPDILNANGWWEQPAEGADSGLWTYHPVAFGRYGHRSTGAGGAVMAVYDVNGDKLNDVVTSLNGHGFGLAWFEQKRDADGNITFERHMISDDYSTKNAGDVTASQLHGSTAADIDGDGVPDFIVGKRYWAHLDNYFDPDPYGTPALYVYLTVRDPNSPGGAKFVPELAHNRSGAGSDVYAGDLNNDGKIDIVTSTDRGTFIIWNKGKTSVKNP